MGTNFMTIAISFMAVIVSFMSLFMAWYSLKDRRELSRNTIVQNRLLDILPAVVDSEYKTDKLALLKSEQIIRALLKAIPYSFVAKDKYIRSRFSMGYEVSSHDENYDVKTDPRWKILWNCTNPTHDHPRHIDSFEVNAIEDYLPLMPRCFVLDIDGAQTPLQDVMLGELRQAFNKGLGDGGSKFMSKLKLPRKKK